MYIHNIHQKLWKSPVFFRSGFCCIKLPTEPIVTRHVFIIKGITDVLLHLKMRRCGCNKDTVSSYIQTLVFGIIFETRPGSVCL